MKICIIGGGTAGWLTSLILTKECPQHEYTVVESSKIGPIGVGEGSTGFLGSVLWKYNIDVYQFMKETDALPKLGIRFKNWNGDGNQFEASLAGSITATDDFPFDNAMCAALLNDRPISDCQKQSILSTQDISNICVNDQGTFDTYLEEPPAFHFDAHKVGKYLRYVGHGPVAHEYDAEVVHVSHKDGKIEFVKLSNGVTVRADLFIDCSGFSQVLPKAVSATETSYKSLLPVDRAFIFKPEKEVEDKHPVTTAWARDNGWIFEIPTRNRVGRGYVYSSQFADDAAIKKELEEAYECDIEHVRTIEFESKRLDKVADKNWVAFGLSSHFFEPLQATSIHNTIVQVYEYVTHVLKSGEKSVFDEHVIAEYNDKVKRLFEDTADFLALHYECGREDTDFWKFVTNDKEKSRRVKRILGLAKARLTRNGDFQHYFGCPGYPLWNLILGGMGHLDAQVMKDQLKAYNLPMDREVRALDRLARKVMSDSKTVKLVTVETLDRYLRSQD